MVVDKKKSVSPQGTKLIISLKINQKMSCFADQHVHLVKGLQTKNGKLPCAISQPSAEKHV